MSDLTEQQKLFCLEYVNNRFNGTQAAILAGYEENSARSQASRLLTNDNILKEVKRIQNKLQKKLDFELEDALRIELDIAYNGEKDSDRLKALDQISKKLGLYEKDNTQKQNITNISLKDMVSFNDKSESEI